MTDKAAKAARMVELSRLDIYLAKFTLQDLDRLDQLAQAWTERRDKTPLGNWLWATVAGERERRRRPIEANRPVLPLFQWKLEQIVEALVMLHSYSRQQLSPAVDRFIAAATDVVVLYLHALLCCPKGDRR